MSLLLVVQVHLACSLSARLFSSRSLYANSEYVLEGSSLSEAKIMVLFSEPIDIATFDINDIIVDSSQPLEVKSIQKDGDYFYFDLKDIRTNTPGEFDDPITEVSFRIGEDAVAKIDGTTSFESNTYTIHYASALLMSIATMTPEGTGEILWFLETSHKKYDVGVTTHIMNGHVLPLEVCNVNAKTPEQRQACDTPFTARLSGSSILYKASSIMPGMRYCLQMRGDMATSSPLFADIYGNYLSHDTLPNTKCVDVEDDPCMFYWGEWSECDIKCLASNADDRENNKRHRTQIFTTPDKCTAIPLLESKPCEVSYTDPCFGIIYAGETGEECDGETNYVTQSGCFCGGTCVEDGNCCQSHYKFLEISKDDLSFAYLFFPCWEPQQCNTDDARPSCKTKSLYTRNFDGECEGRQYKYFCRCGLANRKCFGGGTTGKYDECCGGEQAYREVCNAPGRRDDNPFG